MAEPRATYKAWSPKKAREKVSEMFWGALEVPQVRGEV